jgi:hypothetical protein
LLDGSVEMVVGATSVIRGASVVGAVSVPVVTVAGEPAARPLRLSPICELASPRLWASRTGHSAAGDRGTGGGGRGLAGAGKSRRRSVDRSYRHRHQPRGQQAPGTHRYQPRAAPMPSGLQPRRCARAEPRRHHPSRHH